MTLPLLRYLPPAIVIITILSLRRRQAPIDTDEPIRFNSYHQHYCLSDPVLPGSVPRPDDITFVTQGSLDHFPYLLDLARLWDGPISASIFLSGGEEQLPLLLATLASAINRPLFLQKVRLVVFFRSSRCPSAWLGAAADCSDGCLPQLAALPRAQSYPVNVARNTARLGIRTKLHLTADIQLMPSEGLARQFRDFYSSQPLDESEKTVWVIPVFESNASIPVPRTMTQLRRVAEKNGSVVPFHRFRAFECHRIPFVNQWWRKSEVAVFRTTSWLRPCWEPVFISRNDVPLYDERFQGYGRNKIQQVYEMCRAGFKFRVMQALFLVHGSISRLSPELWSQIGKQVLANNDLFQEFKKELDGVYGSGNPEELYCNANVLDRDGLVIHIA